MSKRSSQSSSSSSLMESTSPLPLGIPFPLPPNSPRSSPIPPHSHSMKSPRLPSLPALPSLPSFSSGSLSRMASIRSNKTSISTITSSSTESGSTQPTTPTDVIGLGGNETVYLRTSHKSDHLRGESFYESPSSPWSFGRSLSRRGKDGSGPSLKDRLHDSFIGLGLRKGGREDAYYSPRGYLEKKGYRESRVSDNSSLHSAGSGYSREDKSADRPFVYVSFLPSMDDMKGG